MVKIWSEWDFGHEEFVFESESDALEWLENNLNVKEFLEENNYTIDELINDQGLIGFEHLQVG